MMPEASTAMQVVPEGTESALAGPGWPRRGGVIMVAGPDGCGKTTLVQELARTWLADAPVLLVHHRRGIGTLPGRQPRGPTTEPHRHAPYPAIVSLGKTFYLFADFLYGWLATIGPFVRSGGWVILQRDWWDLLVDPKRYRLRPMQRLGRLLGRLLPQPDLTIVLDADPDVILRRKAELPRAELARQRAAWRELRPAGASCVHLDASRSTDEVLRLAAAAIAHRMVELGQSQRAPGWVSIPRDREPRWLLPRAPRAIARAGLTVHQPVTPRGRIGWDLARVSASLGLFRLLPRSDAPPPEVTRLLDPFLPAGGSFAASRSNHAARWVALVLAADGSPVAMVKVALDERGRAALARESDNLERIGASLSYPLSAPRILARSEGVLVTEAVRWEPRSEPWRMPEDVAFALGAFFRFGSTATAAGTGRGFSHGDTAPWNLLKSADGWVLVDWEDARTDRPAFHDLAHFLAQTSTLLGRPSAREIIDGVQGGEGWIGGAVAAYARGAARPAHEAWPQLLAYLDANAGDPDRSRLLTTLEATNARLRASTRASRPSGNAGEPRVRCMHSTNENRGEL